MRPSEKLTALALCGFAVAVGVAHPSGVGLRLAVAGGLWLAALVLALADPREGALSWLRDVLLPAVTVFVLYLLLEPVIEAVNGARFDAALAAVDARHLGRLVAAWRGAFGRPAALTDAAYLAYVSYYALPLAVAAWARGRGRAVLERTVFALLLTFYLSYAGYFAWPALGPRVPAADEAAVLGGGAVSDAVRAFLRAAEATTLDAFPSGHTAVSLVALVMGARASPRAAPLLAVWAGGVIFSTVYVSVHYAADVLAGVTLAALALAVAAPLARLLGAPRRASPGLKQPVR